MGRMRRFARGRLVAIGFTGAFVLGILGLATAAQATGPGHYSISATTGSYSIQSTHNLVSGLPGGTADDQVFYLSTTGTGDQHLPFPIKAWSGTFKQIAISANGDIQLATPAGTAVTGPPDYQNECIPTTNFTKPMIAVFWDDLYYDSNDTSEGYIEGVFTQTKGSAPHRKFIVSWQGHHFNDTGQRVLAQIVFPEGSPNFTTKYGLNGGDSATIGTQSGNGTGFAQRACNLTGAVTSGLTLQFLHSS